ncbi:Redoxin-domain-containing protein [Chiua virens]|nr:Redoxin-domain-containing protein [Chiua virens]
MTIAVGETIPEGTFVYVPYESKLDDLVGCTSKLSRCSFIRSAGCLWCSHDLCRQQVGRKEVVVFAVPGAFTPTCHVNHLPGYVKNYDQFKEKGVDIVAVIAANDPFVMSGWARVEGLKDKILALSDANAEWSKKLGLSIDLSSKGMGIRTGRYALVLDNLVVKHVAVEPNPSAVEVTGAEHLLAKL